jgi:hypothetical protein
VQAAIWVLQAARQQALHVAEPMSEQLEEHEPVRAFLTHVVSAVCCC